MGRILHILTREPDALTDLLIATPPDSGQVAVEVFRLTSQSPDYRLLLERIFQADTVAVH